MQRIFLNGKEIILVGTAHISQASIEQVKATILAENPDIVGIELDEMRFHQLQNPGEFQQLNLGQIIESGQVYLMLFNILLANFQQRIGQELGIKPGQEMLEAITIAREQNKSIALLDRNISITLKRTMKALTWIEKFKLLYALISSFFPEEGEAITQEKIEAMKEQDMVTQVIEEFSKKLPNVKKTLVDERDSYIAGKITQLQGKKIVAVVGAGHVQGITQRLHDSINLEELDTIPKGKDWAKIIGYGITGIIILLFAALFFIKGPEVSLQFALFWFLSHGILTAIAAGLARSHPITIIVSFFTAPLAAIHPAIAAGWIAAASELKFNSPQVKDFENLRKLDSFKAWNQNKVTHILLVTVYCNIASSIATFIAFPYIAALFH